MKILAGNVLLRPESNDQVVNGIIIPDAVKTPQKEAVVVTTGGNVEVEVGDRVIFDERSATKVVMDEEYYLMKGDRVLYVY